MRTCKARINWINDGRLQRQQFALTPIISDKERTDHAFTLPLEMLSPDMYEGQVITIQIDNGNRDIDT
jgi:hypothetical protein